MALALVVLAGTLPAVAGLARAFLADEVELRFGKPLLGSARETPDTVSVGVDPAVVSLPRGQVRDLREDAAVLTDGTVIHGTTTVAGGTVRVAAESYDLPRSLVASVRLRAHFTWMHLRRALEDPFSWRVIAWTAGIALLGTLGALLLGVPFAVLTARTDLPGRGLFTAFYAAPLVLPPLLTAMAWDNLLPRNWLEGPEAMGRWSTALQAAALFALAYFPLVTLFTRRSLASVGASAEEAAALAAGPRRALLGVTLPLARPGILLGALFVFVFCLNDFSVVDYLNVVRPPSRQISVYPFLVQFNYSRHVMGLETLLAAGLPVAALSLAAAAAALRLDARGTTATVGSAWRPPRPMALGGAGRLLGLLFCGGVLAAAVLVPVLELAWESRSGGTVDDLLKAGRSPLAANLLAFTSTYARIFGGGGAAANLRLTIGLGVAAAALAVPVAVVLAEAGRRIGREGEAVVSMLSLLPLALVPALVPLGAKEIWDRPVFTMHPGGEPWNPVQDTQVLAVLVVFARVFPFVLAATWASLREAEPSLLEAGELAGVPWGARLRRIAWPLLRPGAALGGLLAFVFAVRELDALAVLGTQTLLRRLWAALHFARDETVAAMAMVLLALLAFAFGAAAALGLLRPRGQEVRGAPAASASRSRASS
jgi:iron(III) transport system permease protein